MGLFALETGSTTRQHHLYLSTRYQIWRLDNLLAPGEVYGTCDRLYAPRTAYTTGDLNVHDVVIADWPGVGLESVLFVNTDFSCLATLSCDYSFVPLWQPPFIAKLVPEDRCHLNGVAVVAGRPAYVTACSATDTAAGWRDHRQQGGVVLSIQDNDIIATGLSMPHSPRWYQDRLWLLNSGTGELGYLDRDRGSFIPVSFCPGFVRGVAFWKQWAIVGLSKLRSRSFTGLPLETRLMAQGDAPHCGLLVIDLQRGEVNHKLELEGVVAELFDVVVLPGVHQPQSLGFQEDAIARLVTFPGSGLVTTKPTVQRSSRTGPVPIAGLPQTATAAAMLPEERLPEVPASAIKYQRVYHLNAENCLPYDALTYPSLRQRWATQPQRGELVGISASVAGTIVGLAIAEQVTPTTATLISLLVLPEYRRQGIGTRLLRHLERQLVQSGCQQLQVEYPLTPIILVALEPLLRKLHWPVPVESDGEVVLAAAASMVRRRVKALTLP